MLSLSIELCHTLPTGIHNPCISRTRHLFCYPDRVESQLDSNKIFRARRGSRNLFWLLNNVKTKNKKYCFCLSCRPGPLLNTPVIDKRPRKWNSTLSWWILDKMFYYSFWPKSPKLNSKVLLLVMNTQWNIIIKLCGVFLCVYMYLFWFNLTPHFEVKRATVFSEAAVELTTHWAPS